MVIMTAAAIPPGVTLEVVVSEDEAAVATGMGVGVATRPGFAQAPAVEFKRPESMMDAVHGGPDMGCRRKGSKVANAPLTNHGLAGSNLWISVCQLSKREARFEIDVGRQGPRRHRVSGSGRLHRRQ